MGARRLHLLIRGRVQGVGFRWFARETAQRLQIEGWVRNLPTGEVEAEAQGAPEQLARFVKELKEGHPYAQVDSVESRDLPVQPLQGAFSIRHREF